MDRLRLEELNVGTEDAVPASLSIWQVVGSVLASFFGVQNSRNRKRDFQLGKPKHFIAVGVVMTAACCLLLWLLVLTVIAVVK